MLHCLSNSNFRQKRFGSSKNISALQKESFDVQFIDTIERAAILRQKDLSIGKVIENRLLTKPPSPVKRHLEFKLPEGTIYTAGDYLAMSVILLLFLA